MISMRNTTSNGRFRSQIRQRFLFFLHLFLQRLRALPAALGSASGAKSCRSPGGDLNRTPLGKLILEPAGDLWELAIDGF